MSHSDDEVLALMALGETVDPADRAHVSGCPRCQSRVDQLSAVVGTARAIGPDDHPVAPPARVWAGITADLGLPDTTVTPLAAGRRRRGRTWAIAGAAAVVGLLVGALGVSLLPDRAPEATVVASADLAAMSSAGVTGRAAVHTGADGTVLTVDLPDLPPAGDGYYEVWMATADAATMVSLGTLVPGREGTYVLPPGLDPAAFPVVDVSHEHFDGDAAHSTESVVRGKLSA